MVRQERLPNGRWKIAQLANFQARIVRDLVFDDGAGEQREFGIEARFGDTAAAFSVTAAEFSRMAWVLNKVGPAAIIYPGQRQHARAAIQSLSSSIRQERVLTHLGWRRLDSNWVYLHAGGAIRSSGEVNGVQMRLPAALEAYRIPPPSQNPEERIQAVRDSLRFLSTAPDRITFPLLAGVYRAALGEAGFSLFLVGPSGVFKSSLAALCQQHFGALMNAAGLPAGFGSTAYALEELAFYAKDALLVVDDFAPQGPRDRALESVAEVLFRAAGNRQGRSRLGRDGRPGTGHAPRALVLATGEQFPRGLSLRARLLTIDLAAGEVNRSTLTECQKAAEQGRFAASMGAFLTWTAGQYEALQQRLAARTQELRGHFQTGAAHALFPSAAAALAAGFEIFLEFATEMGVIDNVDREELLRRSARALHHLMARQSLDSQTAADPALRFLRLLRAALSEGYAHLCNRQGNVPEEPTAWGWRRKPAGRAWVPQGARIGWIAVPDLFLDASASYQIAQQMAGNQPLAVSPQALRRQMRERNLLSSVDTSRHMLLVRRTLEDHPRQVLHLKTRDLAE